MFDILPTTRNCCFVYALPPPPVNFRRSEEKSSLNLTAVVRVRRPWGVGLRHAFRRRG